MAVWTWVLPFVLQAAILGLIMYAVRGCRRGARAALRHADSARFRARRQLVLLADLENDHINPHECARRLNKLVVRARAVAVAAARRPPRYGARRCTSLHARADASARPQMPERGVLVAQGAVYLLHGRWGMALLNGALLAWQVGFVQPVDVTELFRTLAKEKRARLIRLAVAVAVFVLLLVRCAGG